VVVIGGNHDSPSFLNAPKQLLKALNVHVVGAMSDTPEDEIIVLKQGDCVEAIVCAIPYLRDKDIRLIEPGETIDDKNAKLVAGIKSHYAQVCQLAEQQRQQLEQAQGQAIPIIGMGHLFAAGGKTEQDDGVRELYIGNLAHVGVDAFPECLNYVALGHLHVPQIVGGQSHIRYSGSPVAMGYGEAKQQKIVLVLEFNGREFDLKELPIPRFQTLVRLEGEVGTILAEIQTLVASKSDAWLEIEFTGNQVAGNVRQQLDAAIEGSGLEIRRIKNKRLRNRVIHQNTEQETLEDLDFKEVFERCLVANEVPPESRPGLVASYAEILQALNDDDSQAE
jgi:exonuclease SbcD